jgi:L-seryl-tRNA(Ser) seleniumtransferase
VIERALLDRLEDAARGSLRPVVNATGVVVHTNLGRAPLSPDALDRIRKDVLGGAACPAPEAIERALLDRLEDAARGSLRPVVNATGVVVHTNLGRAVLSEPAARRVAAAAASYMDLEYDLNTGERGSRMVHLEPLLGRLMPGRAFTVVNNNAAAIFLTLRAVARGRDVIVSRGELVEIGGSFRVPEIMAVSGAKLREVGTTNRTRLRDYEAALTARSGAILKVHTSNFKIVGFTEEAPLADLAALAKRAGVPLVVDWGSGDLVDLAPLGIDDELPVARILDEGADVVTFSGDKLLGGPQAGIIAGRPDLLARIRKDPLARVCRIDRLQIAAMREVLSAYVRGRAFEEIPTLRMIALDAASIARRAEIVCREVGTRVGDRARLSLREGVSRTGGGSSPLGERPTMLVIVESPTGDAGGLERALRTGDPPIIGRVQEGRLLLDLRTVLESQDQLLVARLSEALESWTVSAQTPKRKMMTSPSRTT